MHTIANSNTVTLNWLKERDSSLSSIIIGYIGGLRNKKQECL